MSQQEIKLDARTTCIVEYYPRIVGGREEPSQEESIELTDILIDGSSLKETGIWTYLENNCELPNIEAMAFEKMKADADNDAMEAALTREERRRDY